MNTWDTDKYYDRIKIDRKKVINLMFIFDKKRDGAYKIRFYKK